MRRRSDRLKEGDQTILDQLAETNHDVYLGWLLLDQLRCVYLARDHDEAMRLLDEWVLAACVSELEPFVRIAITFDTHRAAIANAITLAITNARLEGMNSTVRLLGSSHFTGDGVRGAVVLVGGSRSSRRRRRVAGCVAGSW